MTPNKSARLVLRRFARLNTLNSVGTFDLDRVQPQIIFRVGQPGEAYSGIGRGEIKIEGLPVFADHIHDWQGFVVRALNGGGLIFEKDGCRTLADAMVAFEKGLRKWFAENE